MNDLPPGSLATRLLAAGVRVVLTHIPPDAASPVHRRTKSASDAVGLLSSSIGRGRERSLLSNPPNASGVLMMAAGAEHVDTPDTEEEESSSDEVAEVADKPAPVDGPAGADSSCSRSYSRRPSRSGGRAPIANTPSPGFDHLQIAVMSDDTKEESGRRAGSLTGPLSSVDGRSGSTPMFGNRRPSPLRSCPRAAVSRSDSFFGESRDDKLRPAGLPRWSSSKIWGTGATSTSTDSMTPTARSTDKLPRGDLPPAGARSNKSKPKQQHAGSGEPNGISNCQTPPPAMLGRHYQTPLPLMDTMNDSNGVSAAAEKQNQDKPYQRHSVSCGTGHSATAGPGGGGGEIGSDNAAEPLAVEERKPWAALTIAAPTPRNCPPANKGRVIGVREGASFSPGLKSSLFCWNDVDSEHDKLHNDDHCLAVGSTDKPANSHASRKPSPAVQRLLESTAERSFEDPLSSSRQLPGSIPFFDGSDTDRSPGGARTGSSSSDSDDEKAARVARALAGWVDSGMRPSPQSANAAVSDREIIVGRSEGGEAGEPEGPGKYIETEDLLLANIPPLKQRGWPPPRRPVVAGEMEVHEALVPDCEEGAGAAEALPQRRAVRQWASTGMSWGEEAKLALARKRLQWQKWVLYYCGVVSVCRVWCYSCTVQ